MEILDILVVLVLATSVLIVGYQLSMMRITIRFAAKEIADALRETEEE